MIRPAHLRGFGAKDTVHQLRESDGRKRRALVSRRSDDPGDQLLNCVAAPLGSDHQAGVEDQSHAGGSSGSRWLSIAASTSLAKSASSVAVQPCSLASRKDSESNLTFGSAGRSTATGSLPLSITTSAPARTRASVTQSLLRVCPSLFQKGLPQQAQANDSIDAKFSNSLVRSVYLLRLSLTAVIL